MPHPADYEPLGRDLPFDGHAAKDVGDVTLRAGKTLDLGTNGAHLTSRVVESASEPTLQTAEAAFWWDTTNSKMYWGVERSGEQYWIECLAM